MIKDFLEFFLPIVLFVVAIISVGAIAIATIDYLDCSGFAAATGRETTWKWGCYVKTADGFVPKDYVFGKAKELRLNNGEHK